MLPITQPNPQKIQNRNQKHIPIPFISNQRWTNREPLSPISTTQAHAAQTNFSAFALPTTKVLSSLLFAYINIIYLCFPIFNHYHNITSTWNKPECLSKSRAKPRVSFFISSLYLKFELDRVIIDFRNFINWWDLVSCNL